MTEKTNTDNEVIVLAPIGVTQDFVFTALDFSRSTMKSAIKARLDQFFSESTDIGVNFLDGSDA